MREVSGGDSSYERLVTEQFLELLPADLSSIETAWQQHDIATIKQLAHNLKTTISVMGLNNLLQPYLDALEYNELTDEAFQQTFAALQQLSNAAMEEAQAFYASLDRDELPG
jgi:HPt (histidine-containing phosphotransfer) domain-containing protein